MIKQDPVPLTQKQHPAPEHRYFTAPTALYFLSLVSFTQPEHHFQDIREACLGQFLISSYSRGIISASYPGHDLSFHFFILAFFTGPEYNFPGPVAMK
jgi:hypothetical protein